MAENEKNTDGATKRKVDQQMMLRLRTQINLRR